MKRILFLTQFVLLVIFSSLSSFAGDPDEVYFFCDAENKLIRLNRSTQALTVLGTNGGSLIEAITYNSFNDTLYATNAGEFGMINRTNAAWTVLSDPDIDGALTGPAGNVGNRAPLENLE